MDKWDELVNRIKQGMLAEEPEAAMAGALQLLAEFGRTFEMISADMDRIATSLEHNREVADNQIEDLVRWSDVAKPPVHDL